jgi:hypothetical protein
MLRQSEHSHITNECYQERIQELAETYDNEYHMSALPLVTNKERAIRGQARILQAIEEFKELLQNTKCIACLEEINRQILLQKEGLREIEQVWNL